MYNLAKKYLLLGLSLSLLIVATIFFFDQKKQTIPQTEIATTKLIKPKHIKYEGAVLVNEPDNIDYIITELEDIETAGTFSLAAMAQSITTEALKAFTDSDEHTLPLLSHWNVGIPELTDAMNPMYMIDRIEQGEYILVSWKLDPYYADTIGSSYYEESIKRAAELQLPLIFILPAPESALTKNDYYKGLPPEENPNVIDKDANVLDKLSPFGPDDKWKEVGEQWSTTSLMSQIQEWYPNPPLVIFTSEDEASKLTWNEIDISSRYLEYYSESSPETKDDNYKRTLMGGKWIEKYRQLQNGFKEGFTKSAWKDNVKFISYNKLSDNFGKSADWMKSATVTNQYINLWPLATDGVTIDFDLTGNKSDITEDSPHVLANNLPFMLKEAKGKNAGFAYQLNIDDDSKITDTARYRGLTQFALWFLRPNIIRQKSSATTRAELEPKFEELIDSVNLIHYNPEIAEFWKNGKLVPNGNSHLNYNIPEQYQGDPRWFLLDTSNDTDASVWAFSLLKGEAPNREWLIYVQSPENNISNITVSIPDYENILVDSKESGNFYVLSENNVLTGLAIVPLNTNEKILTKTNIFDIEETTFDFIFTDPKQAPVYLGTYIDPIFKTHITRITSYNVFANNTHPYPKVQAFNSDSTYIRVNNKLLDTTDYSIAKTLTWMNDYRWARLDPNKLFGISNASQGRFSSIAVDTNLLTTIEDFDSGNLLYDEFLLGKYEGSQDFQDEWVVFNAHNKNSNNLTAILYNIKTGEIRTHLFTDTWDKLDYITVSPSGSYILMNWADGVGSGDYLNSIYLYDMNFNFLRVLVNQGQHGDIGFNQAGKECWVAFGFGTANVGIWSYPLDGSPRVQELPDKYGGGHISCQNFNSKGYCYVSTNQDGFKEVFALKLDGNHSVKRFVKHHQSTSGRGSPSPNGFKVLFQSTMDETSELSSYVVE